MHAIPLPRPARRLRLGPWLIGLVVLVLVLRLVARLWVESLWFGELGYADVFRTRIGTQVLLVALGAVAAFVPLFASARAGDASDTVTADFKSALQEWAQGQGLPLPQYHVAGQVGQDHRALFLVEVKIGREVVAAAEGRSKKQAAQEAARLALEKLRRDAPPGDAPPGDAPPGERKDS